MLEVDLHARQPVAVDSLTSEPLGAVTPSDYQAKKQQQSEHYRKVLDPKKHGEEKAAERFLIISVT